MLSINCEISHILTLAAYFVIYDALGATKFSDHY